MIVVDIALFICIFMLGVELLGHRKRLDLINDGLEEFDADIGNLKKRCEAYKELIEALSKSVRELNGVVEAAVKSKEPAPDDKPDVEALIGGWITDEGQTGIDASHIRTGLIDGQSLMNCELPNISEPVREKIFELFGVKIPEDEHKLTAHSMDRDLGYMLRIVLTPLCGKIDERLFPYDEISLGYNADKGYVRIDDKHNDKLRFLAPMDSIAYMERVESE